MSFEEAEAGLGTPAVGIHRDRRAVILDDRYDDAPVLEDGRLLARLSRTTRLVVRPPSVPGLIIGLLAREAAPEDSASDRVKRSPWYGLP